VHEVVLTPEGRLTQCAVGTTVACNHRREDVSWRVHA
jgi:hypothetical protein